MASMVLATLVVGFAFEAQQAQAQQTQPNSLQDEQLSEDIFYLEDNPNWPQPTFTVSEVNCDPNGTSTFKVSVTGTANGPYPGTFEEDVTVTIGPQTMESGHSPVYPVNSGELTELTANFKIHSGDKEITGTKQLVTPEDPNFDPSNPSMGTCETWEPPLDLEGSPSTTAFYEIDGWSNYEATITNTETNETSTDSGLALVGFVSGTQQLEREFHSGGFNGQFVQSNTPPPPPDPVDQVDNEPIEADGVVSTGNGGPTLATASDPINTSIYSPVAGTVSITETSDIDPNLQPSGFTFFGQQIDIEAPQATPEEPLDLRFVIDSSLLQQSGVDETNLQVFRDGVRIEDCDVGADGGSSEVASPDPCIKWISPFGEEGDLEIAILSSHASSWNVGVADEGTPLYDFSGFFTPVDNPTVLNRAKAGSAIPAKFSLEGNRGLDVFSEDENGVSYPKSQAVSCTTLAGAEVDAIEQTVSAEASGLSYDATSDRYTYAWKTDKKWANSCRQLIMRFEDGTERKAYFQFTK